jgi:hypothetical protein
VLVADAPLFCGESSYRQANASGRDAQLGRPEDGPSTRAQDDVHYRLGADAPLLTDMRKKEKREGKINKQGSF